MQGQEGKPLSDEDRFYLKWGQETLKNNITLCNDILKQLITLNSALLGVTIIFEKVVLDDILKSIVLISFFISLIFALIGLLPYQRSVNLNMPDEIKIHKEVSLRHKQFFLIVSSFLIVIGFGIIVGELVEKLLYN